MKSPSLEDLIDAWVREWGDLIAHDCGDANCSEWAQAKAAKAALMNVIKQEYEKGYQAGWRRKQLGTSRANEFAEIQAKREKWLTKRLKKELGE